MGSVIDKTDECLGYVGPVLPCTSQRDESVSTHPHSLPERLGRRNAPSRIIAGIRSIVIGSARSNSQKGRKPESGAGSQQSAISSQQSARWDPSAGFYRPRVALVQDQYMSMIRNRFASIEALCMAGIALCHSPRHHPLNTASKSRPSSPLHAVPTPHHRHDSPRQLVTPPQPSYRTVRFGSSTNHR